MVRKLSLLLLVLVASSPVWGIDASRYKVEVIVFETLDHEALQDELWPANPGEPSLAGAVDLEGAGASAIADFRCLQQGQNCQRLGQSAGEPRDANQQAFFHLLPAAQYQLNGVVASLEGSGRYRLLIHIAWQQPALTRTHSLAVRLAGGWPRAAAVNFGSQSGLASQFNDGSFVDGSFRLYRGRYLHVLADLMLYRSQPTMSPPKEQSRTFSDAQQVSQTPPPLSRFRLSEHRRMRSRELHYLDHPLFGLVVQITPYLDPRSSPLAPADGKLGNEGVQSGSAASRKPDQSR